MVIQVIGLLDDLDKELNNMKWDKENGMDGIFLKQEK